MQDEQCTYEKLKEHYGSHSQVARELGLDPRHYRAVRNEGRASASLKKLIEMFAANARKSDDDARAMQQ